MADVNAEIRAGSYLEKRGLWSWITSTDHKRIGLLYFYGIATFFFVAVILGFLMRTELAEPGKTILEPKQYNQVFTLHGVIMIFLFIIPGIPAVFGNVALPIMIGAPDVSFPRLNLFSWYLYLTGAVLALSSLLFGEGGADTGWTFYAPYSVRTGTNVILTTSAAFVLGFSSILTGLNFLTTIHRLRAPGMSWFRMPLFVWALYATAWIQVLATPVIGITLAMVILERLLGVGLFDPSLGGDPILYQHLFWIYSHPAVYIMVLPAMGVISEIIPTFTKRRIYGYKAIAYSSLAIAFIGYVVWGHHMYTAGMSNFSRILFSILTFLVAIPSAIKIFNWISTMYKGSISVQAPLLFALGFIFNFLIGGLTGLVNGALAADIHIHDTYFVVAHFHYVMFGSTGFAFFGALHYWYPKMFGRMYNETRAKIGFWLLFIGFQIQWIPMFVAGLQGMPRRYYDYPEIYSIHNLISTIGAYTLITGFIIMAINTVVSLKKGERATSNPWGSLTLEWQVPSPPPTLNFDKIPTVTEGPYEYHK